MLKSHELAQKLYWRVPSLIECPAPPSKPFGSINKELNLLSNEVPLETMVQDIAWLLSREFTRAQQEDNAMEIDTSM